LREFAILGYEDLPLAPSSKNPEIFQIVPTGFVKSYQRCEMLHTRLAMHMSGESLPCPIGFGKSYPRCEMLHIRTTINMSGDIIGRPIRLWKKLSALRDASQSWRDAIEPFAKA